VNNIDTFFNEINEVLCLGDNYRDRVIIRLLVLGGLKTGRLLELKVADIDFDNFRFKGYNNGNPVYIPLDGLSMLCIRLYILKERPQDSEYNNLLLSRKGNPLDIMSIVQILDKYRGVSNVNVDCRTLRLSALAVWLNAGVSLKIVMRRGGYTDSPRQRHRVKRDVLDILE